MIEQGLMLTVIGMATVFFFLLLMVLLMSNMKTLVDLLDRVFPEPGTASEKETAADLPMVAAAVFIAARYGR